MASRALNLRLPNVSSMTMATTTQPQRFLGLDLAGLWQDVRATWRRVQDLPALQWFTPPVAVRVLGADGGQSVWYAGTTGPAPVRAGAPAPRFTAVELPEALLLVRRLSLPPLPENEVAQAVALDVAGASPFAADDAVWGWSARPLRSGLVDVQIALASRAQVQAYVNGLSAKLAAGEPPEVWAMAGIAVPVVLRGFGEARRLAFAHKQRLVALALAGLAIGLAALAVATPVIQKRMRAVQAVNAFDALNRRAEPALRQRAQLVRSADTATALKDVLAQRADPLYAMEVLTQALPDDTSLLGVQVQGTKVSINGVTGNAAALMQQLSARQEFRDVKAPVAATRPPGAPKDVFSIELTLVPRAAPVAQTAASPGMAVSPLGIPLPGANAPAKAAAPAPPPANTGGASFGGAAAFGGAAVAPAAPAASAGKQP
jgi:general secretion pathway protein L